MIELAKCQDTEGTQMTTHTSGAACRAIEDCPELNMSNYDEVGVEPTHRRALHPQANRRPVRVAGPQARHTGRHAVRCAPLWLCKTLHHSCHVVLIQDDPS